jgi:D-tyrosyl-tRNA(Tyr) deacylase
MRIVLQKVKEAAVCVQGSTIARIETGLLVFIGISREDTTADAEYLTEKILGLRIFEDHAGKLNHDVGQVEGSILIVSQFTLHADCRRGRRPSFDDAAPAEIAEPLYEYFVAKMRLGPVPVQTGKFRADMEVRLTNDGPITILLDSKDRNRP